MDRLLRLSCHWHRSWFGKWNCGNLMCAWTDEPIQRFCICANCNCKYDSITMNSVDFEFCVSWNKFIHWRHTYGEHELCIKCAFWEKTKKTCCSTCAHWSSSSTTNHTLTALTKHTTSHELMSVWITYRRIANQSERACAHTRGRTFIHFALIHSSQWLVCEYQIS